MNGAHSLVGRELYACGAAAAARRQAAAGFELAVTASTAGQGGGREDMAATANRQRRLLLLPCTRRPGRQGVYASDRAYGHLSHAARQGRGSFKPLNLKLYVRRTSRRHPDRRLPAWQPACHDKAQRVARIVIYHCTAEYSELRCVPSDLWILWPREQNYNGS